MTFLFANNARTTLASSLTATATSIFLASGGGDQFPSPGTGEMFALFLTSASSSSQVEVCYCTARSSDTLTVTRGMDGTTAQAFSAGDYVTLGPVAGVTSLFAQAGYLGSFSSTLASSISGYAFNAILADASTAGKFWVSTASSNTTVPGNSGASWTDLFDGMATETWVEGQDYATETYVENSIVSGLGLAKYNSNPGYSTLPGGMIIQYGRSSSGSGGNVSVSFPIAFPSACVSVTLTESGAGGTWPGTGGGGRPTVHGMSGAASNTSFGAYSMEWNGSAWVGESGLSFSWMAIGY